MIDPGGYKRKSTGKECTQNYNGTIHPCDEPRKRVGLISMIGKDMELRVLDLPVKLKDL